MTVALDGVPVAALLVALGDLCLALFRVSTAEPDPERALFAGLLIDLGGELCRAALAITVASLRWSTCQALAAGAVLAGAFCLSLDVHGSSVAALDGAVNLFEMDGIVSYQAVVAVLQVVMATQVQRTVLLGNDLVPRGGDDAAILTESAAITGVTPHEHTFDLLNRRLGWG